jgi:shikimate kinase
MAIGELLVPSSYKNPIFIGYKSSGKTYFGKLLSKSLGWNFIDTDDVIEKKYKLSFCTPINASLGD